MGINQFNGGGAHTKEKEPCAVLSINNPARRSLVKMSTVYSSVVERNPYKVKNDGANPSTQTETCWLVKPAEHLDCSENAIRKQLRLGLKPSSMLGPLHHSLRT